MRFVWLGIALVISVGFSPVFADELILEFDPDETLTQEDLGQEQEELFEENVQTLPSNAELQKQNYLRGYQQLFSFNQDEIAGLEAVLVPVKQDLESIDTQLQFLDAQIQRNQQLEAVLVSKLRELQVAETRLNVQQQLLRLEMRNVLSRFEKLLQVYIRVQRKLLDSEGRLNFFQLFVSSAKPADVLFQDYLIGRIQQQMLGIIQQVSGQQEQIGQLQTALSAVRFQFQLDQERLQQSAVSLAEQIEYQQSLLSNKQEEQQFFLEQLEQARNEQILISQRIEEIATGVTDREYRQFPVENFVWPVAPLLGISAHFHDSGYKSRFGLEHNAVDIPTDQLTPVKAPLSGRVLKVHDAGLGYSYLQLGHKNGLSTVYGHVYAFKVQEGDVVQQGQVIALSGGAIGTKGAGRLTTGPHLHFEVLKDGEHVDPEDYLPEFVQ